MSHWQQHKPHPPECVHGKADVSDAKIHTVRLMKMFELFPHPRFLSYALAKHRLVNSIGLCGPRYQCQHVFSQPRCQQRLEAAPLTEFMIWPGSMTAAAPDVGAASAAETSSEPVAARKPALVPAQRLFDKELDNQHEEPLLLAQLAAAQLQSLLVSPPQVPFLRIHRFEAQQYCTLPPT